MKASPLLLASILAASLLTGCSDDLPPGEMKVAVQRSVPAQDCWATVTGGEPDPQLPLDRPCPAADPQPHVTGGSDLIRLVIDYGSDVAFTPGTKPPLPTVTMTLDGVATPTGGSIRPGALQGERAFFLATFKAPAREVTEMVLEVQAAQGFGHRVPQAIRVDAPRVEVTIDQCKEDAPCELTSGTGTAAITVTVPGSTPVDVTLTSQINNILQPLTQVVHANTAGGTTGNPVMTGSAFPVVPVAPEGATWKLIAQWGTSEGEGPVITLRKPVVELTLDKCAANTPCHLISGVDVLGLKATVPGMVPGDVTLTSTIDGLLQPGSTTISVKTLINDASGPKMSGPAHIVAPVAKEGAQWVLHAQYGASTFTTPAVTLHTPVVDLAVQQCGMPGPCVLTGGVGSAVLDLRVPAATAPTVTLTWAIDNVLQQGSQMIQLGPPVMTPNGQISMGTAFLPVPAVHDGATWQIFAQHVGMTSGAQAITIQAPTLGAELTCGPGCVPKASGTVALRVTAPEGFITKTALVSTSVDGVPSVNDATLTLSTLDVNAGTISGVLSLPVPNASGATWQIDTVVGPYKAPTILTTIEP
jgi:hypothetical protein